MEAYSRAEKKKQSGHMTKMAAYSRVEKKVKCSRDQDGSVQQS
jgi:hypothetical protein